MSHGEPLYESVKRELGVDPDYLRCAEIARKEELTSLPEGRSPAYGSDMDITTVPIPSLELTAQDRCDRCGAQAYTRATFGDLSLLFCMHHTTEQKAGLEEKGWTVSSAPV